MNSSEKTASSGQFNRRLWARFERSIRAIPSRCAVEPALVEEPASETESAQSSSSRDWQGPEKDPKIGGPGTNDSIEERILGLYSAYRPRLYRYLQSLRINSDQADEIVQEVFLRLTGQLLAKQDIRTVEGWAIRVAHNLAMNACEVMEREKRFLSVAENGTPERADPAQNPEQTYLEKERAARMNAAVQKLSAKQRTCFLMRTQGFQYKDIAAALGITTQRAAVLVQKAASRLAALCE